ncbi:hypothetical protein P154DRAFT_329452 [Amniculicola lignicola CBS 123094]|uniref:Uncharacterized protein n=1 Tax=Amniculicola lignicola CBS 123094 TaxID=1392246 RepID=A0A6A5W2I9_9PLEO|nr:hypothetical protein P154DRAFT_329452 [Amniculicola lignicola CBS 123094]
MSSWEPSSPPSSSSLSSSSPFSSFSLSSLYLLSSSFSLSSSLSPSSSLPLYSSFFSDLRGSLSLGLVTPNPLLVLTSASTPSDLACVVLDPLLVQPTGWLFNNAALEFWFQLVVPHFAASSFDGLSLYLASLNCCPQGDIVPKESGDEAVLFVCNRAMHICRSIS